MSEKKTKASRKLFYVTTDTLVQLGNANFK